MLFCRLAIHFVVNFFEKFFQEYHQSVKQLCSGLIWVQTVYKEPNADELMRLILIHKK